jgi:hypothetical protein
MRYENASERAILFGLSVLGGMVCIYVERIFSSPKRQDAALFSQSGILIDHREERYNI